MVVIVLVLLIWWQPRFIFQPLRVVLTVVAWPVQGIFSSVAFEVRDVASFLGSIGSLKRENEQLSAQNIRLLAENAKWQSVSQENDELRKELNLLPREAFQLKAAEVVARDAAGLGSWLTIDQGSLDGVERGMPVIVYDGVLVGRVTEVFPGSARVMLLSHPESLVSGVTVEGESQGIVKGEYGLGIVLDMVLQDAPLHAGDHLVTSGLGGDFPKNLTVGTLQDVHSSVDHLYQRSSVVSPVRFDTIRYVFVITKSLTP